MGNSHSSREILVVMHPDDVQKRDDDDALDDKAEHHVIDMDLESADSPGDSPSSASTSTHPNGGGLRNRDLGSPCQDSLSADSKEMVELNIVCAHNLRNVRRLGIMNPRAAVYFDKPYSTPHKHYTPVHYHGGTEPHWNNLIWLRTEDVSFQNGYLTIDIYDWMSHEESQLIGTTQVPLVHLSGAYPGIEFFTYPVRTPPSGICQGVLHVTVKRVPKQVA